MSIIQGRNVSISLNQQIKDYQEITQHLKSLVGDTAADRLLSKSLFIFSTGNNDMLGFYTNFGLKNATQQDLLIGQLTNQFKNQLQVISLSFFSFLSLVLSLFIYPSIYRGNIRTVAIFDGV